MKINLLFSSILCLCALEIKAQTNIINTDPLSEQVMLGNYNPDDYKASAIINHPAQLVTGINARVSPDSLKRNLEVLSTFRNRNTGSDTVSNVTGIGAARRWVFSKFQEFSRANENRLIISYLQFDQVICGVPQHRNIVATLPGMDTADKSIIIIEGHIDSRCAGECDITCLAEGMEDNGSGTSLVMELARIMSAYSFNHTIVFTPVIGEEQGLYGGNAFAKYAQAKGIKIKGVFNNDVIGGIICGKTSSPPSCPGENNIDSTQVRLFSFGGFNSPHKGLARFIKLEYKEELRPIVQVPMMISIMSPEDRTGRGGDHIPFRQTGFTALRFTSANEHGNASASTSGYTDRQHTFRDILGVDTNSDGIIDSFFVDFNYLARNTVINGASAALMGIGPKTPDFILTSAGANKLGIVITQQTTYQQYRVGVRTLTNDFDSVYTITGKLTDTIFANPASIYFVSVASVDSNGIESLFSKEYMLNTTGITTNQLNQGAELLQNSPNPADEATIISVLMNKNITYKNAFIRITDIKGSEIKKLKIDLKQGINEVLYEHGYNVSGTYIYTLEIDGKTIQSKNMVFTN